MADSRNLVLQLLITARDEASSVFGKVFSALNDSTNVIAGKVRDAFTGLFGGAVDSAAAFEEQLGKVTAKGDETYQNTDKLKTGLQDIAAQFGITGTEAAQGMEVLAAAGLNAADAIKALPPVLALAKMENLSLDDAATKLSDSLSIMGMGFAEAGRMADVLAKGANISTASAASLAEALSGVGGQAVASGMSLEQTVAALDMLHAAGIKGGAAGTSLAAILTQLQNPASTASVQLNALGISSRDLGTVLDELNAAGPRANTAILAFGETAGPGLRALIGQGSAALKDYENQLMASGGAAQNAANQLNNNFNSALAALSAAWDNVKSALAEPILQPIADGAREVATAINTALTDGALKPAQEAIKTFATEGVAAVREFVQNFDFKQAMQSLGEFLTSAKTSFEGIRASGETAANVVTIAWNALSAGFKTIGAGLLEVASTTMAALAATENAASKIGLGSAERASELRQTANGLQAQAEQLIASVAQDSAEMGAAYDRMTGKVIEAKDAQEQLKTSLPTAELQQINYTLKDYQALADQARAATDAARIAYDAGTITAKQYGDALLAAADANKALADAQATQDAIDKTAASVTAAKNQLAEYDRQIKAGNDNAAEWRSGQELNNVMMLGMRDAAQATADKLAYLKTVKDTLPGADKAIAEATAAAQAALDRYNAALAEHVTQLEAKREAVQRSSELEQKSYDLLIQQAQAEEKIAALKGDTTAATYAQNDATDLQNQKAQAAIDKKIEEAAVYADLIAATREKLAADGELNAADQAKLAAMADTLTGLELERQSMEQSLQITRDLTDATKAKAEADKAAAAAAADAAQRAKEAAESKASAEKAASSVMSDALSLLRETGGELDVLSARFYELQGAITAHAAGWDGWAAGTARAAQEVKQAYEDQRAAVTGMTDALDRFNTTGEYNASIQQVMIQASGDLGAQFDLLDQQTLDGLRGALDSANDKLREMQQVTEDARARLAELNAEIAAEKGDTATADRLKLELQQRQALAEAEAALAQARAADNQALVALYQEQIDKLNELYTLKEKNLEADIRSRTEQQASSSSGSSSSNSSNSSNKAGNGQTYTLNLNAGGKSLQTTTNDDPAAFLAALENARLNAA